VDLDNAKMNVDKAELHLLVRQLSYKIMDLDRRSQIVDELDTYFTEWRRIALLQQQQGEINKSVYNAIDLQYNQNKLQKLQLLSDREMLLQDLKQNINSEDLLVPITDDKLTTEFSLSLPNLLQHPTLKFSDAVLAESKARRLFNESKLLPEITVGYSSQSIVGWQTSDGVNQKYYGRGNRFGVIQLGLGIPIFNGSAKAKVKASILDTEIAEIQKTQQSEFLSIQYAKLVSKYIQYQQAFQYYEREGLKLADEVRDQAAVRLKAGEISYSEWNLLVGQSLQIKLAYLTTIFEMQNTMAEYIYLTEKN
jgi:cobalt-zinc-cadmium resistance protein CzcA